MTEWHPMLATLAHEHPQGAWLYERKLDGVRALAFKDDTVRLRSRNGKLLNGYPEIVDALGRQPGRFAIDGEIVAFEDGRTSFSKLQGRMQIDDPEKARETGIDIIYYVFDVLAADGEDLRGRPVEERKEALRDLIRYEDPVRFTDSQQGDGRQLLEEACRNGWEGLIAKRAGSKYTGKRSRDWLKLRCGNRQEFVIGGFTTGARAGFGALLLGQYEDGRLRYAGKVGTGFDSQFLHEFGKQLQGIETERSPFHDDVEKSAHFVQPQHVGEIRFTEWTPDGKLRHPVFLGLRYDKSPSEVVRTNT